LSVHRGGFRKNAQLIVVSCSKMEKLKFEEEISPLRNGEHLGTQRFSDSWDRTWKEQKEIGNE
jgi:hypothetical protein